MKYVRNRNYLLSMIGKINEHIDKHLSIMLITNHGNLRNNEIDKVNKYVSTTVS